MRAWMVSEDGTFEDSNLTRVASLAATGTPFWLDVFEPTDAVIDELATVLGLHPLAVEDAKAFGQRGSMVVFDEVAVLTGFGLDPETIEPVEVHAFVTRSYLVTLHRAPCAALDGIRAADSVRPLVGGDHNRLLHHVAMALHREFPPCIDALDARLGELGAEVLRTPDDAHLIEIAQMNQVAAGLRRTLNAGRELTARLAVGEPLPGSSSDPGPWLRDIGEDLHRIVSDLEALEDRCLAMLQLHASLASNRVNASSSQLAVVATIFLPITFLVGFFGQNFNVLVSTIQDGWISFLVLGVSLNVLSILVTVALLNRRGLRDPVIDL